MASSVHVGGKEKAEELIAESPLQGFTGKAEAGVKVTAAVRDIRLRRGRVPTSKGVTEQP